MLEDLKQNPKLQGSPPGELSWLDEVRIRIKVVGAFIPPAAYAICKQLLDSAGVIKGYTGPLAWILVGGLAGGVVVWYERNFLRNSFTPGLGGGFQPQFPPIRDSEMQPPRPGGFNPPPV